MLGTMVAQEVVRLEEERGEECDCTACRTSGLLNFMTELIDGVNCSCPVCQTVRDETQAHWNMLATLAQQAIEIDDEDEEEKERMGLTLEAAIAVIMKMLDSFANIMGSAHKAYDRLQLDMARSFAEVLRARGISADLVKIGEDGSISSFDNEPMPFQSDPDPSDRN